MESGFYFMSLLSLALAGIWLHQQLENRRRRIRRLQVVRDLLDSCDRTIERMRLPAGHRLCLTENDLLIESYKSVNRAKEHLMAIPTKLNGLSDGSYILGQTNAAEMLLYRANTCLDVIERNLRPLIERVRGASAGALDVVAEISGELAESQAAPGDVRIEAGRLHHAAARQLPVAPEAPVRALCDFRTELLEGLVDHVSDSELGWPN